MSCASPVVMNWDCQRQGCFNQKKRLKFGVFKDCLPGRISFTDVDGIVEVNGNLLLLEWKDHQSLGTGQRILFTRLTMLCPATVLIVEGDAEHMTVESLCVVYGGVIGERRLADLGDLRKEIRRWADWAMANPAVARKETGCK